MTGLLPEDDMTTSFSRVTPPGWGTSARDPELVLSGIDEWVRNAALAALVEAFDGQPPAGSVLNRLNWLERFSAEHWDFRAGQERNLARSIEFDESTNRLILDVADALGLTHASPPAAPAYTHLLILGGLVRACILRPRHAAGLIEGGLQVGTVSALSAYRPLRGDENDLIEVLGLSGRRNEMEVMEAGLVGAFGLAQSIDEVHHEEPGIEFSTELVRAWRLDDLSVRLVIAPSAEPQTRRSNTADTYAYWADACVHLKPEDSILLVTSSIYLPYQHADAVRMLALPHGCSVETVGLDFSDENLGPLRQSFTPANYLQEVRSAIRGIQALHTAATAMTTSARTV
jgi:hypothetical protein